MSRRCFYTTARILTQSTQHKIGPPDPISHMRPIIYADDPAPPARRIHGHPYSVSEFPDPETRRDVGHWEFHYKMQRRALDELHKHFWTEASCFFLPQDCPRESVLESLPSDATATRKEEALSEFYRMWVMQEDAKMGAYTTEWRARNWRLFVLWWKMK
ncbi:hypothetical protein DL96DRAFT_1490658, partial [Flagelloscypha sp. PMI_526]